jgi:hypothetical protein
MSGSSSAFSNGYLADRQQANIQRKDLDLNELIILCSKPLGIDERVAELQRYSAAYPELKLFLIVAYFYKNAFSQINSIGPINYIVSKVPKGGSVENIKSMWREITKMYDEFPSGAKAKRGKAQTLLGNLHADDAALVASLISGTFYNKELNEVVVSKAFPKETPQDPKA